jgi:hypothetical protein
MSTSLGLWKDNSTRRKIEEFVKKVTTPGSPDYVPPADRIATFDNDGTLWCEKPAYVQLFFGMQRLKDIAKINPSYLDHPNYRAAVNDDLSYFTSFYPDHLGELAKIVFDTHSGMSQPEFLQSASDFLATAEHPRFKRLFKHLTYQPMVELMRYLEAFDFKNYIATAGGMSFVRTVSEEIYGISRERVIGSNVAFDTQISHESPVIFRKAGLIDPIADGPGKPVSIELHIGRKPILAAGNADGDLEMLWYSQTHQFTNLQLLLIHDDEKREYAYHHGAEKVQKMAKDRGWLNISMKNDFLTIFND